MKPEGCLSVVIPTYNRAAYLAQAVDSALAQEGVEIEVVIVDDGSTDDTDALVARRLLAWGERVRYERQPNSERCVARNRGLQLSRGEFVAFLDSDDVWRAGHARACLDRLREEPAALAAYGEYGVINGDGAIVRDCVERPRPGDAAAFQTLLCLKRLILHPTEVVLRRTALPEAAPFDADIPGAEDWLLWVQLAAKGAFLPTGRASVWMRNHGAGTFGEPVTFSGNLLRAAEKVIATGLPARLGLRADRIRAINRTHCAYAFYLRGDAGSARAHLREAVRLYAPIVWSRDFLAVASRLALGTALSRRLREYKNRGRHSLVEPNG